MPPISQPTSGAAPSSGAGFSYESDIAPIKKRYFRSVFNNPLISPSAAAELSIGLSDRINKRESDWEQSRARDIQFQSAVFTLDKAREDAARERDMLTNLAPFQKQLEGAASDPTLNADERTKAIGILGVQNAGLFATNPAAAQAFRAATISVTADKTPKMTAASYVSLGGDYSHIQDYGKKAGIELTPDTVLPFDTFASGLQKTKEGIAQTKQREKDSDDQQKEIKSRLGTLGTLVNKAEVLTPNPLDKRKTDPTKFDSVQSEGAVKGINSLLATPQEKKELDTMNAAQRIAFAQKLYGEYLGGSRTPADAAAAAARSSAADLFK